MICIKTESLLSLSDAAKLLPRRRAGRRTHVSTLWRWAKRGCRGIRLEVVRVGGTLCTSEEALQRFVDRMTTADASLTAPDPVDPPADQDEIEQQLDDLGV